jgi:hypothetical protein
MSAKKRAGRPTDYSEGLVDAICLRIAEGESLRSICRDEAMPSKSAVMEWLLAHEYFRTKYAHARVLQADVRGDEMLEIADDGSADYKLAGRDGEDIVIDHEHVARSKLRVETRKWLAEKLAPKKYGAKVAVEASGPDGGPIPLSTTIDPTKLTDDQLRTLAQIRAGVG